MRRNAANREGLPEWWALHARRVAGETLTAVETAALDAALARLDAEESYAVQVARLAALRHEVEQEKALRRVLLSERRRLERQLRRLEAELASRAKVAAGGPL